MRDISRSKANKYGIRVLILSNRLRRGFFFLLSAGFRGSNHFGTPRIRRSSSDRVPHHSGLGLGTNQKKKKNQPSPRTHCGINMTLYTIARASSKKNVIRHRCAFGRRRRRCRVLRTRERARVRFEAPRTPSHMHFHRKHGALQVWTVLVLKFCSQHAAHASHRDVAI